MAVTRRVMTVALLLLLAVPAFAQTKKTEHWVATWATALVARPLPAARGAGPGGPPAPAPAPPSAATAPSGPTPVAPGPAPPARPPAGGRGGVAPPVTMTNQTIRQVVHTSIGGNRLRVVLSNAFGTANLDVGAAHVALRDKDNTVVAQSVKPMTVGGAEAFSILAGATVVSDPIDLTVPPLADLVIDVFVPGEIGISASPVTTHNGASQTNFVSQTGNHSGEIAPALGTRAGAWFMLARVEVVAPTNTGAVAAFGDSITDGARSTADMNARWPDQLARRLAARKGPGFAVLNAGISGNRVLGDGAGVSALARFDRDVLMQTGVTHVIVMEGINDIGIARSNPTPSAADLIAGHKQLIARAHARGLKIYGATLTPYEGAAYFTPEGETKRQALNQWIRT